MSKAWKGSYTVEAAVIMPVIVFIIAAILQLSFDNYRQVVLQTEICQEMEMPQPVKTVRFLLFGREIAEEIQWK